MFRGVVHAVLLARACVETLAVLVVLALAIVAAGVPACSTVDTVRLADGGCVGSGCGGARSLGTGGAACASDGGVVGFQVVFDILTSAGCTNAACHGGGETSPAPRMSDAHGAYAQIMGATFAPQPYVVPGDPNASQMLCNLVLAPGQGMNAHGACGVSMPLSTNSVLTQDDLATIAEWIACGATEN